MGGLSADSFTGESRTSVAVAAAAVVVVVDEAGADNISPRLKYPARFDLD